MNHTIRKINQAYFKDSIQTLVALLIDNSELFYVIIDNGIYLVFEKIESVFKYRESNGIRINCFEISEEQYNNDNYLISLFVKDYSKFSDQDLINELQRRSIFIQTWTIKDVDKAIENVNKDRLEGHKISLGQIQKEQVLKNKMTSISLSGFALL